jgi:hypothetical protein
MKAAMQQARDQAEESYAQQLAKNAREEGLSSVDSIELKLDAGAKKMGIRPARVKQLANSKLGGLNSRVSFNLPVMPPTSPTGE